jgi:hypothetical protein
MSCDAVTAVLAPHLMVLPLARLSACVTCPSIFCACCVLTRRVPFCLVYSLDCHRAARESCCDAVAAVPAAPLTGLPLA